ncbi:MAG: phage tail protein, partial [Desulfobacterales bacterium]|nr:phage tail protein [Desulfobacterales bacterium]
MTDENSLYPLHVFRFQVEFFNDSLNGIDEEDVLLCGGAFSEVTGLEATMEPRVIMEGGLNFGALQRSGPVTFSTVILKRGVTTKPDLWKWWELVTAGAAYAYRLYAIITLFDAADDMKLMWFLNKALPIKFKAPDFNAAGGEVGVEELHLAHE